MEELKLLVESIAGLPDLAIWVVAMYFFFKLVIVGSVYGVIRYTVGKWHDYAIKKKEADTIINTINLKLGDKVLTSTHSNSDVREGDILDLLDAVRVYGGIGATYVFRADIKKAVDLLKEHSTK